MAIATIVEETCKIGVINSGDSTCIAIVIGGGMGNPNIDNLGMS